MSVSLRETLKRIDEQNPTLHAFITVADEHLLSTLPAEKRPLHGMTIGVEDSLQVEGMATTHGSLLFKEALAEEDDPEIALLKEAGAVIVGKTNLSEFGFPSCTENRLLPPPVNPHYPSRTVGGTSGGAAAAVAAGLVTCALGSDSLGGVRVPSSLCGLYALKPTRGRIPIVRNYLVPPSEKMFHQKGIIAHQPEAIGRVLQVLAHPLEGDLDCCALPYEKKGVEEGKICLGFSKTLGVTTLEQSVASSFDRVLVKMGKKGFSLQESPLDLGPEVFRHFRSIFAADRYLPLSSLGKITPDFYASLAPRTCDWYCYAGGVTGIDYSAALLYAQWVRQEIETALKEVDFLLTPAVPTLEQADPDLALWGLAMPFNLSGHPALVIPFEESGLQLIGRYYTEHALISCAQSLSESGVS